MTATIGYRTGPGLRADGPARSVPVVVIGAGQAGLSAAYHLRRRGLDYVVLDGEDGPGGAWRHRWRTLRMATVNGIFDLPGMPKPPIDTGEPAADAVPRYFAAYEREFGFPSLRPVRVHAVRRASDVFPAGLDGAGWPATTCSSTPIMAAGPRARSSTPPARGRCRTGRGTRAGRASVARVEADARAGRPIGSIVSYTGLSWTSYARAAAARGALARHPMFTAIEPGGVLMADGTFQPTDVILWATGFRQAVDHLSPLRLRNDMGGIALDGTAVAADPRVHLIGYGPSQSTVGANRAGRAAAAAIAKLLPGSTAKQSTRT